jgi:N-acetylated-alpha-linked acidic dipeptidase
MRHLLVLAACVLLVAVTDARQPRTDLKAIQSEVSIATIEATLRAIDVDRTGGSPGERKAFEYLAAKLAEYGIRHATYETRQYLSWPGRAELRLPGGGATIVGKTAAFAAPTPPGGLSGALVVEPKLTRRADQTLAFGPDVRGKIPLVQGIADTEALVLAGMQAGAIAVVQMDQTDKLHEDIVTTIWGSPTTESAARLPSIPFLCITKSDGDRVKAAAAQGPVQLSLTTEVTRGWASVPIVTAEVPGASPDFVLVTTHVDAWYRGMTDTAGSVASILDMARLLQQHQGELRRGVRFAWWSGHSFGRYAGSGWYVDRFWSDLDEHCVAYTNLDGPGRRGSRLDQVSASGWPGMAEYAREFADRLTGKSEQASRRGAGRVFRPGRDSDSAYQGLGIPFFSVGVPGPPQGHNEVDAAGRISYWHAEDDTFDKLDMKALERDTQYRVAQLYDLAALPVLPHRLAPVASSYVSVLKDLAGVAGTAFDLSSTSKAAAALADAALRFDQAPRPTDRAGQDAFNRVAVKVTHRLNSALYTKAGRFDQDPAAELPVLPLLARVKDLAQVPRDGDEFGFLTTELLRGRNAVDATLREASEDIEHYLAARNTAPGTTRRAAGRAGSRGRQ